MKKKIAWITGENFIDVDLPIVPEVNKLYEVNWNVIFPKKLSKDYSDAFISFFSKENNITNNNIHLKYRFRNIKLISIYYQLIKKINAYKPDIIYVNFLGIPYFFLLAIILLDRKKIIYAAHDVVWHKNDKKHYYYEFYQKMIFKFITNFHLFSNTQKTYLQERYKGKNAFVAPLFLKNYGAANIEPSTNLITFLFFGIIRGNKGLELLIKAGNKLCRKHKNRFKIIIAGKCENWDYYQEKIECAEIFDIRLGIISNSEMPNLFGESHYVVLPYLDVTQSGVVLTAYNYNIPVIASDHPGFREYITHGKDGYLFPSENIEELYNLMKEIIEGKHKDYKLLKENLNEFINNTIALRPIVNNYFDFFNSLKY